VTKYFIKNSCSIVRCVCVCVCVCVCACVLLLHETALWKHQCMCAVIAGNCTAEASVCVHVCCYCRKLHCGSISADMKVVHKNGVGVDCRLENLMLFSVSSQSRPPDPNYANIETGIYWRALQHVVVNPVFELSVGFPLVFVYEMISSSVCYTYNTGHAKKVPPRKNSISLEL